MGAMMWQAILDLPPNTTLLVSARAKGLDLVGLNEPEEHLAMDMRQRATRD